MFCVSGNVFFFWYSFACNLWHVPYPIVPFLFSTGMIIVSKAFTNPSRKYMKIYEVKTKIPTPVHLVRNVTNQNRIAGYFTSGNEREFDRIEVFNVFRVWLAYCCNSFLFMFILIFPFCHCTHTHTDTSFLRQWKHRNLLRQTLVVGDIMFQWMETIIVIFMRCFSPLSQSISHSFFRAFRP